VRKDTVRIYHADDAALGWYFGPWNTDAQISVGYANTGFDEPHLHTVPTEICLVARGTAQLRVEQQTLELAAGDVVAVEPGEAHTFLRSSPDYFHFVVHTPGVAGEAARAERQMVERSRLGLSDS
jgi:uncharacterized protein YjlB